jgi:membrane associated rhomboid family serine protease
MIPLRDDRPTRRFPVVTLALVILNVAVFVHELMLADQRALEAFFSAFAVVPARLTQEPSPAAWATVFSAMFLHAGWLHLIGNMLYLWIFGNNVEAAVGRLRFLLFYLVCGVAAALTHVALAPESRTPMVGASGAVSGVLGAYLLLLPRARVLVLLPIWIFWKVIEAPAVVLLLVWFAFQLFSGLAALNQPPGGGGIAWWAHIGGFVAGMALIPLFKKRRVRLFQ